MTKDAWETATPVKKPPLFTVEISFQPFYDESGQPAKKIERWYVHNQSWPEITSLRERLFTHGFFLERSPGRGEIIFPFDFRKILIDIQREGFKDGDTFIPYK